MYIEELILTIAVWKQMSQWQYDQPGNGTKRIFDNELLKNSCIFWIITNHIESKINIQITHIFTNYANVTW